MTDIDTLAATLRTRLNETEQRARDTAKTVAALGLTPDLPLSVVLVRAIVARDRRLLDLLLAEKHVDLPGFHCDALRFPAVPGKNIPAAPCDCGRDALVAAYLTVFAEAYEVAA